VVAAEVVAPPPLPSEREKQRGGRGRRVGSGCFLNGGRRVGSGHFLDGQHAGVSWGSGVMKPALMMRRVVAGCYGVGTCSKEDWHRQGKGLYSHSVRDTAPQLTDI